eukprot:Gregarina_sp_Poly_1__672@NODE_115_length_13858_cov_166_056486_g102_i0_p4_GENE_NODE_115_length_13858_cov_166_056486_g102_i0NODE_115_length_13858_cov_166_056486_g102_i0_p4_ORF_typecomplete_len353_score26_68DHHC/PF01529_20/2e38_NODE_115_length_13858_cov_166_056486_g102_i01491207
MYVILIPTAHWSVGLKATVSVPFGVFGIMALWAHLMATLTDPGFIPIGTGREVPETVPTDMRWCDKCNNWKSPRGHHCSVCNRCVIKMDHHCPWVNNCVGLRNQKHFILFNIYVAMMCTWAIGVTASRIVHCSSYSDDPSGGRRSLQVEFENLTFMRNHYVSNSKMHSSLAGDLNGLSQQCGISVFGAISLLFLAIESLLFGVFTIVLCCEQVHSILTGETGVEAFKSRKAARLQALRSGRNEQTANVLGLEDAGILQPPLDTDRRSRLRKSDRLRYVFGPAIGCFWLLPVTPRSDYLMKDLQEADRLCLLNCFSDSAAARVATPAEDIGIEVVNVASAPLPKKRPQAIEAA